MTDIQLYIDKHQLDLFGILEADLHGAASRVVRANPLKTADIMENLKIPGYNIILPQAWYNHGQARIIAYCRDNLQFKVKDLRKEDSDLQSISLELGWGK